MSREPRHLRAAPGASQHRRSQPGAGGRSGRMRQAAAGDRGDAGGAAADPAWPGAGPSGEPDRSRRRSWRERAVLAVLGSIVVLCLAGASVGGYVLVKYNSIDRVGNLDLDQPPAGDPENFLVVAVDTREGHATRNTDTIMVVRVDPQSDRLALTSFPRDLVVTIADTGEAGMINSAYARPGDGEGEQNLIDTLRQNFGIPINHFVEVTFDSFQEVVDAVGGVSVWLPSAVRDLGSGLYSGRSGCVQLDGTQALGFVRARKLQVMSPDGWRRDPLSDENRVRRQQIFVQRALDEALSQVRSNPLRVAELVDIGVENVRFDRLLTIGDIVDLGNHFREFDADRLETYVLPVLPHPQDSYRLVLDEKDAQPSLNVFRGLPPGELSPVQATVRVLNGTGKEGFARDISGALQNVGFDMEQPENGEPAATTAVHHAPWQASYGQLLARYLTTPVTLVEDPDVTPGNVVLVAGQDFTTVHEQPTPEDRMPTTTAASAPAPSTTATTAAASTTTTTRPPPTTTTTEPNPFVMGEPPRGETCE